MSALPDSLGDYRIRRILRSSKACHICEGVKLGGGGRFALKVLRREFYGDREQTGYLKHEFEVAHTLSHPSVIGVHEFNTEGKIAYLVLELFALLNLKQALRSDPHRVLCVFDRAAEQAAAGLQALHERKWAHCDVKPDNFLIDDDGTVKLIDFTIAQRITRNPLARLFGGKSLIQGTRSYMSPEQIRGKPLDARADVYSLGCVYYELLTAKLPYTGASPDDLLTKHLRGPIPSVLVHNNNVTNELADLLRRMMAKQPEQRPQSMGDVLKELKSMRRFKVAPKPAESSEEAKQEADG